MTTTNPHNGTTLVSICLPVRNGADRLPTVIGSVLAQTHENLELVVCDNASTDGTDDVCRELVESDRRVVYHRHATNVGLLNNFISAMKLSRGSFFRWVGHDDWLPPHSIARSLEVLREDDRPILATTRVAYTDERGETNTDDRYDGTLLASEDPIARLGEMLRLLNERALLLDPLYGFFRRAPVSRIPRRNMVKEDEVFAAKLALAGPWVHVPDVLIHRRTRSDSLYAVARRLDVPPWEPYVAGTLQCRELLRWLRREPLTPEQHRQAKLAVLYWYRRRVRLTVVHRARKVRHMAADVARRG